MERTFMPKKWNVHRKEKDKVNISQWSILNS